MDLTWSADEEAFRAEVRGWLETELAAWRSRHDDRILSGDTTEGFAQHLDWERTLFAARYAVVSWPEAFGGRAAETKPGAREGARRGGSSTSRAGGPHGSADRR